MLLQLLVVVGHLLYGLLFPTGEPLQLFLLEAVDFLVDGSEEQVGLRLAFQEAVFGHHHVALVLLLEPLVELDRFLDPGQLLLEGALFLGCLLE